MGAYIDDALTADEAAAGYVLTCQMKPKSDCVLSVPASAAACKTEVSLHTGRLSKITRDFSTTVIFSLQAERPVFFLPGQYVNLQVPGTKEARAYSFSSVPNQTELSFLIRDVPGGLMSNHLRNQAGIGDAMTFAGPYGSFYLRPVIRPVLMLAGGTGLAPFLSMLRWIKDNPVDQPVLLAYGVNTADDLVELGTLAELKAVIPGFDYFTVVLDAHSGHSRTGYVTDHLARERLNAGNVDVYVCGPPPMVEGVRQWMAGQGLSPKNFLFEKFSSTNKGVTA
jgi:benzoate/toluate 1,2-dioxygenase reductase subunit